MWLSDTPESTEEIFPASILMKKVERHPGINHPNFRGSYFDPTGRDLKCYCLPKREAELMVMSESLEVSASLQPVGDAESVYLAQPLTAPSGVSPRGLKSLSAALVIDRQ